MTLTTKDNRLLYTQLQVSDVFWCTSKPNFEILSHRVTNMFVLIFYKFCRGLSPNWGSERTLPHPYGHCNEESLGG